MSINFIQKRNIIVIGRVGTGKSTLINKVLGDDELLEAKFSFQAVTKDIQQVDGKLEIHKSTKSFDVTIIDTVGMNDGSSRHKKSNPEVIAEIKEAIADRLSRGVNLILITVNLEERFAKYDQTMFDLLELNFNEKFWKLSVLVFTHCDKLTEKEVNERLKLFSSDQITRKIADFFEDRIITVGFPSLDTHDESNADLQMKMKNDIAKLHKYIENAKFMELPKYIIKEQVNSSTNNTTSTTTTTEGGRFSNCIIL